MDDSSATARRLYRSRQDRVVAGVAGGLGQYMNIDPVLVRLGFVLLGLTSGGLGLVAYIIMAIIVPNRPEGEPEPSITSSASIDSGRGREIAGYLLLGLGVLILASNLGMFRFLDWDRLWPLMLIAAGALLIVRRSRD